MSTITGAPTGGNVGFSGRDDADGRAEVGRFVRSGKALLKIL
jgi:hypothetical protein